MQLWLARLVVAVLVLPLGPRADAAGQAPAEVALVHVEKAARRLTLRDADGHALATYVGLQLGSSPAQAKRFAGDGRTPEGRYTIDYGNSASAFWLSLHISYPNAADRAYAAARGRSPGGAIFLHGQPNSLRSGRIVGDWTDGCIALSNEEIEQLWTLVPDGTPIQIDP